VTWLLEYIKAHHGKTPGFEGMFFCRNCSYLYSNAIKEVGDLCRACFGTMVERAVDEAFERFVP